MGVWEARTVIEVQSSSQVDVQFPMMVVRRWKGWNVADLRIWEGLLCWVCFSASVVVFGETVRSSLMSVGNRGFCFLIGLLVYLTRSSTMLE